MHEATKLNTYFVYCFDFCFCFNWKKKEKMAAPCVTVEQCKLWDKSGKAELYAFVLIIYIVSFVTYNQLCVETSIPAIYFINFRSEFPRPCSAGFINNTRVFIGNEILSYSTYHV